MAYSKEKECKKCNVNKPRTEYYKHKGCKDGLSTWCKSCFQEYAKSYSKSNNYKAQKKYEKKTNSEFQRKNQRQRKKRYYQNKKTDEIFKLKRQTRTRVWFALKRIGEFKDDSTEKILGISIEDYKIYLENLFVDGMTWDNYGQWHIDHIKPLSSANNKNELIKLCHFKNTQPLWAVDNLKKGAKHG